MTDTVVSNGDGDRGLYAKYNVERLQDPDGKHGDCRYFVLDPQHDPLALQALKYYARLARRSYPALADDLDEWTQGETDTFIGGAHD